MTDVDLNSESFKKFQECAVELLSVNSEQVTLEARFREDLDADSLDVVEFVMKFEEEFNVEIPESELNGVSTIGEAYKLVLAKQAA